MFQLKNSFKAGCICPAIQYALRRRFLWRRLITIIVLSASVLLLCSNQAPASDVIAVKPRLVDFKGQASKLPPETIREIFFMRLNTWPDGSPIRVFVLPDDHPLHIRFAKEILGVYPFQLRSAWDRLLYSGTGVAPTTVETQEEMQKRIESTPGAIGYVSQ